jgi:GoLoco motif
MAKENHDPSIPSSTKARLPSQKSLEKSHRKSPTNNASDLFELLERCQSNRLDDQRCVLPSYFSQVSKQIPYDARKS